MDEVVTKLKDIIIIKTNMTSEIDQIGLNLQLSNEQQSNSQNVAYTSSNNSLHGELSQTIRNFHNMNTNEIEPTTVSDQEILYKKDLSTIIDEISAFIFKEIKVFALDKKPVLNFLKNQNITSYGIYDWLSDNQTNSNSIFLFGILTF